MSRRNTTQLTPYPIEKRNTIQPAPCPTEKFIYENNQKAYKTSMK